MKQLNKIDMKQKVITEINKHRAEIEELMRGNDYYLYLVVFSEKDLNGNDWHSPNDDADSLEYIFDEVNDNELLLGVRYSTPMKEEDWKDVKSWYLELWENDAFEDDTLVKSWKGNLTEENENYGYIGITDATCASWDYFEEEPKHLREIYALTKDGYEIFHSWNEEGGYEDWDEMQILETLTMDEDFSKQIGHFVYD